MDKKQTIGYCRVSTEAQEKKGFGLDVQEREIKRLAKNNHLVIDCIFKDEAISGIKEERQKLDTLLNLAKQGKIKAAVFAAADRTARSVRISENIYHELESYGVRVYIVDVPHYDPANRIYVFFRQILEAVAEFDRKTIIEKLKEGRKQRVKEGKPPGGNIPYGYKRKNKKWKIDPCEAEIVKLIFDLADRKEKPFKIAKMLNEQGIKRRDSKEWLGQQIKEILSRKQLYQEGIIHYGGATGKNKKLIIVDDD